MQLGIAVYVLNVTYDDFEGSFLQEAINIAAKLWVMSPSSPTDKLLLVQSLRRSGHVVAATEEGTNDGPALHEFFASKVKKILMLGGAFFALRKVNLTDEANVQHRKTSS
ncbi:hypothetical protein YC2023_094737 [Brassica napus]